MIVTLIVPFDEGLANPDGVRVVAGLLNEQQLTDLLTEPAYARRAVQRKYTRKGAFLGLRVTYNNDTDVNPDHVDTTDDHYHYEGKAYFDHHSGCGHLAYETSYVELESPPGMGTYTLTSLWTEPDDGSSLWLCRLTKKEAKQVKKAIAWLKEHAGYDWGHTLASWDLQPESELTGKALEGLDRVLAELKLQSRYEEDPTYYGPDRYPPFENLKG